jgi:hypothetical protein
MSHPKHRTRLRRWSSSRDVIGDGVAAENTVEREIAARGIVGQVLELAELRLHAEPERVAAKRPAGGVREAVNVFGGPCVLPPSPWLLNPEIATFGRP